MWDGERPSFGRSKKKFSLALSALKMPTGHRGGEQLLPVITQFPESASTLCNSLTCDFMGQKTKAADMRHMPDRLDDAIDVNGLLAGNLLFDEPCNQFLHFLTHVFTYPEQSIIQPRLHIRGAVPKSPPLKAEFNATGCYAVPKNESNHL